MNRDRALPRAAITSCCVALYESDWARLLFGDSLHPGGLALTERLGMLLELRPGQRVLDVASGTGASALLLAERFGCEVVGLDYGAASVARATARAENAGLAGQVRFERGDAQRLQFAAASFDAVICECAYCTFPDKRAAAGEFARVLRPGGRVGLSDLTRSGPLPVALEGLLAWIACVADAQPLERYVALLAGAGLGVERVESHDQALQDLVRDAQTRLLGTELLLKLDKLSLPAGIDLDEAKALARHASAAVQNGTLGYALIVGNRP